MAARAKYGISPRGLTNPGRVRDDAVVHGGEEGIYSVTCEREHDYFRRAWLTVAD